jgi:hypothetical protein
MREFLRRVARRGGHQEDECVLLFRARIVGHCRGGHGASYAVAMGAASEDMLLAANEKLN